MYDMCEWHTEVEYDCNCMFHVPMAVDNDECASDSNLP